MSNYTIVFRGIQVKRDDLAIYQENQASCGADRLRLAVMEDLMRLNKRILTACDEAAEVCAARSVRYWLSLTDWLNLEENPWNDIDLSQPDLQGLAREARILIMPSVFAYLFLSVEEIVACPDLYGRLHGLRDEKAMMLGQLRTESFAINAQRRAPRM